MSKNWQSVCKAAGTATIIAFFSVGTGGVLHCENIQARSKTGYPVIDSLHAAESRRRKEESQFVGDLRFIRAVLTLRIGQLGEIFGVSRQTAHSWLKGSSANSDKVVRAMEIANAITQSLRIDNYFPSAPATRILKSGYNLVESLSKGEPAGSIIKELVKLDEFDRAEREFVSSKIATRKRQDRGTQDLDSFG